ncbi:hypothetical protein [Flavivirga aquatica]|nr:hypothetical protein [Flavivirga aquatica]
MMKNESLQKLKAFEIKRIRRMESRQIEFLEALKKEKQLDDWLSVKDVIGIYSISRKTFDRLRLKGLKVSQQKVNGKILVQRKEIEKFLTLKTR